MSKYEYVVVGGGTAGAVIARRLGDAGKKVCLIEAGPNDAGDERIRLSRNWDQLLNTELDFDYELEARQGYNPLLREHIAKVLGGCSSHNNTIALRPPAKDIQIWIDNGAHDWKREHVEQAWTKVMGALWMEQATINNVNNKRFLGASTEAGLGLVDFDAQATNSDIVNASCVLPLNSKNGERQSSSVGYLHPLTELPENLTLLLETTVTEIILDDQTGAACGVRTDRGDILASQEVIITAGALNTPKLLMLSGIGPAGHLQEMGIRVHADLPVGDHLLDHPEAAVLFETAEEMGEPDLNGWEVAAFSEEIMIHFTPGLYDDYTSELGYPTAPRGISMTPNVRRAVSEGTVRLRSANPQDPPRIDANLLSDPEGKDITALVNGIRLARKIAEQPSFAPHLVRELAPGEDVQSDEELASYARAAGATVFHPAGTCKMGPAEDSRTVTTPDFRVKGVDRLRVADASIFPTMTGVNPCMTVFIISEMCAALILNAGTGVSAEPTAEHISV